MNEDKIIAESIIDINNLHIIIQSNKTSIEYLYEEIEQIRYFLDNGAALIEEKLSEIKDYEEAAIRLTEKLKSKINI